MTVYYVDDGGSNTAPYDTWAKAAPTIKILDTAVTFATGDIAYIGHDSIDTTAVALGVTGPSSGLPLTIISATTGSSPPTYQLGTADQIATSAASTNLVFTGIFALYGITVQAGPSTGYDLILSPGDNDSFIAEDSTFVLPPNGGFHLDGDAALIVLTNCVVDLTADGTTARSSPAVELGLCRSEVRGLTFVNAGYRTGTIFANMFGPVTAANISDCDLSGFTNATTCEIFAPLATAASLVTFQNCKTAATWTAFSTIRPGAGGVIRLANVGPSYALISFIERVLNADLVASSAIYRSGGAAIDGSPMSWLITTETSCGSGRPYFAPWIIGTVTDGSHTFDVFITNDTADFTDAEVWLEVEYLPTSGSALGTIADDQRADITTTAAVQTDDTTSTWTGTGPSFTYKQKLSVTVTVGQAGQYRARVVVAATSIAGSRYFYVDPLVTVS